MLPQPPVAIARAYCQDIASAPWQAPQQLMVGIVDTDVTGIRGGGVNVALACADVHCSAPRVDFHSRYR